MLWSGFSIFCVGSSLRGKAVPLLFAYRVASDSWRAALENLPLTVLIVILPLRNLSIRGKPSEIGSEPEPDINDDAASEVSAQQSTIQQMLAHPAYWCIAALVLIITYR